MKFSKVFWLPIVFLVADIFLRLYILWLNLIGATDLPNSLIIRKGINFPQIQQLMIAVNLAMLAWTIYIRKTSYKWYKYWIFTALAYLVLIFMLMDNYSNNVVGSYLGINMLILNNVMSGEQREMKGLATQ